MVQDKSMVRSSNIIIIMFIIGIGGLCPNLGADAAHFNGNWLLLLLMMVQHKNMVRSTNMIIIMFIIGIGDFLGPERISVSNQIIP